MRDFVEAEAIETPERYLGLHGAERPVMFFAPSVLAATAARFINGFDAVVSYAVKANPSRAVLETLVAAGVRVFDVASIAEMAAVRAVCAQAVLHYNNPVRSKAEVAAAQAFGIASASVDSLSELEKLRALGPIEVSVRLALAVPGAAYDFGAKFGVGPDRAVEILRRVVALGFRPAMTFHPGTQCDDPNAWAAYIAACADVARRAGVRLERLNVGGGFAAHRAGAAPDLEAVFARISSQVRAEFGADAPILVCEPGRAMVAESHQLAVEVKAVREDGSIFVSDGVYGGLAEWRDIAAGDRVRVFDRFGAPRGGARVARVVFGPTCDSIDRLPEPLDLPQSICEGDHILFAAMGAYSTAIATGFNGYGVRDVVRVAGF